MRLSIAARLAALTLACTTVILLFVVGYAYMVSRDTIVDLARKNGDALAQATANRINAEFRATAKVTETVAATLEDADLSHRFLLDLGRRILFSNPGIFGTAVAFEPDAFERGTKYFAPYSFRKDFAITSVNLGGEDYNYFAKDWYQLARELNRPVWTEPYYDEGGGDTLMITYSAPFSRRTPRGMQTAGVVTADIDLAWLQRMIASVQVTASGHVFLLSRYGAYIAHPDPSLIMNETIFTHAEDLNLPPCGTWAKRWSRARPGSRNSRTCPGSARPMSPTMPCRTSAGPWPWCCRGPNCWPGRPASRRS